MPAHHPNPTLFLFDIDGTLLSVDGAGKRSFVKALHDVDVREDMQHISFAGATDVGLWRKICADFGVPEKAFDAVTTERFYARLAFHLEQELAALLQNRHNNMLAPYSAASWLLHNAVTDGHIVGLVTGNIKTCAAIKVRAAGLHTYFGDFFVGGYGDLHPDRNHLAQMALDAAQERYQRPLANIVLIGDTPSDIAAALHIGAVGIGVSGVYYSPEVLQNAGAHHVLDVNDATHMASLYQRYTQRYAER